MEWCAGNETTFHIYYNKWFRIIIIRMNLKYVQAGGWQKRVLCSICILFYLFEIIRVQFDGKHILPNIYNDCVLFVTFDGTCSWEKFPSIWKNYWLTFLTVNEVNRKLHKQIDISRRLFGRSIKVLRKSLCWIISSSLYWIVFTTIYYNMQL